MVENNAWSRSLRSENTEPHVAGGSEDTSDGREQPAGGRGSIPPREARELYRSQSPRTLETNSQAGERPELRIEERILAGDQLNSAELQPLVCLIEVRGKGLLRSGREGDELRTGTNMRALLSALASGRAEIERIGQRGGWSVGIKEEMMDRLQSMVRVPLQKGCDLIMSSIPYSWREQYARRVRKADGVIDLVMPAVTTNDWSLQNCQVYLVEPGGSAGGVPKLAGKESEEHGSRVKAGASGYETAEQGSAVHRDTWQRTWSEF